MNRIHGTVAKKVLAGGFTAALLGATVLTAPAALADDPIGEGSVELNLTVESTGELSMTVDNSQPVVLTEATSSDPALRSFTGTLPTVTVTDTRSDIPEGAAWAVIGQSSDFTNTDESKTISSTYLGWTPELVEEPDPNSSVGAGSPAFSEVVPEASPDDVENLGLSQGTEILFFSFDSEQAQADSEEFKATAALDLLAPAAEIEADDYTATLTLSLFEDVPTPVQP